MEKSSKQEKKKRSGDNRGCEKSFERSEDLRLEELENCKSSESWQEGTL